MDIDKLLNYWKSDKIITDKRILRAFKSVDRRKFVPSYLRLYAYDDKPLPIGEGQTISQPTTVAIMVQALEPRLGDKILEVGAGSGYEAAILSKCVGKNGKVITIEYLKSIYKMAKKNLKEYSNVEVVLGDGSKGYEKEAPYDRIIVSAASPTIPKPLLSQLKDGGIMVIPVGEFIQEMYKITKKDGKIKKESLGEFRFVELKGEFGFKDGSL